MTDSAYARFFGLGMGFLFIVTLVLNALSF